MSQSATRSSAGASTDQKPTAATSSSNNSPVNPKIKNEIMDHIDDQLNARASHSEVEVTDEMDGVLEWLYAPIPPQASTQEDDESMDDADILSEAMSDGECAGSDEYDDIESDDDADSGSDYLGDEDGDEVASVDSDRGDTSSSDSDADALDIELTCPTTPSGSKRIRRLTKRDEFIDWDEVEEELLRQKSAAYQTGKPKQKVLAKEEVPVKAEVPAGEQEQELAEEAVLAIEEVLINEEAGEPETGEHVSSAPALQEKSITELSATVQGKRKRESTSADDQPNIKKRCGPPGVGGSQ